MFLINATSGNVVAEEVRDVRNAFSRMIGLLRRRSVSPREGIWLAHCPAVHTIGMRATLDLIFLDGANRVLGTRRNAVPNRPYYSFPGAKAIVELGAGSLLELALPGDVLALVERRP